MRVKVRPAGDSWSLLQVTTKAGDVLHVVAKVTVKDGHRRGLHIRLSSIGGTDRVETIGSFGAYLESETLGVPTYKLTDGTMRLDARWQGAHLGTWCQNVAVDWALSQPVGHVASIYLAKCDAVKDATDNAKDDEEKRTRRNAFYERYGIQFIWSTHLVEGHSKPMLTSQLLALPYPSNIIESDLVQALNDAQIQVVRVTKSLSHTQGLVARLQEQRNQFEIAVRSPWRWAVPVAIGVILGVVLGRAYG